jgi:predicted transcriptional regulator
MQYARLAPRCRARGLIMNIATFLTPKSAVVWVSAEGSVAQALERMRPNGFGSVPILDEEGRYLGTLSASDLMWHLLDAGNAWQERARSTSLMVVARARHDSAMSIEAGLPKLLVQLAMQSFVSVVDERGVFIGIVRRRPIIEHYGYLAVPEGHCEAMI